MSETPESQSSAPSGPPLVQPIGATAAQAVPVHHASQLAIGMTVNELSLTFGRARQVIDPNTGGPAALAALEWLFTVSLPLPTAVALRDGLVQATAAYETAFGK